MLQTNCPYLQNEIMDVVRAFNAEECDFVHYFSYSRGKFLNCVEFEGKIYDFCEEFEPADDEEYRRFAKRFSKLAIYSVLSAKFGELPWGALTGIRPTKLAYGELNCGRDFAPLFKKFGVSDANCKIVAEIISAQKEIYGNAGQSLYISLPFCPTKCDYCSFVTAPIEKTKQFVEEYIDCIEKELEGVAEKLTSLRSVYIGGGTPFVLGESQLTRIYAAVSRILKGGEEYTVEAGRPDVFSESKLAQAREWGVNRLCVNPQSFSDATLEKIGRRHTAAQTVAAFEMAKKYGFKLNCDLIAGLADEKRADFSHSLDCAIALSPENITVHTLSLKAGAKLKERQSRLEVEGIKDMIDLSRELLHGAGYEPYYLYRQKYQAGGLENVGWTKSGSACVYNVQTMEELGDNIALGAGAITKRVFSGGDRIERYASPKDIPTYINKLPKIIESRNALLSLA